jgi:subtilisin family serine protease
MKAVLSFFRRSRSHGRPLTGGRKLDFGWSSLTLAAEQLEARALLAADGLAGNWASTSAQNVTHLEWLGRSVAVRPDAWVGRIADSSPAVSLDLAVGWAMQPLGDGFFTLEAPGASVAEVLAWAGQRPAVAMIEPDFAITPTAIPNDPSWGSLWSLHDTGQAGGLGNADIDAPAAWNMTTGSRSVVVAVLDTGVDWTHPDLADNIWRNPGEVAGDGIDNDGNGYVDDVIGWDFANNDADPMDDNGHGTHVTGTIGAVGDNGVGVVGVNWQVSIMPLKFLSAAGSGSTSGAVAALAYATRMKREFGINIVATNNSWGGGGFSATLRAAIAAGGGQGILFVTAAGNDATNIDHLPAYPAAYDDSAVIAVAATDRANSLAAFSNYGAASVDIAAPGVGIFSTVPRGYASYSGTSMAAPHVSGVVALAAAANPSASAAEIRTAILTTATPVTGLARKVGSGGLLNAAATVIAIRGTPEAPGLPTSDKPVWTDTPPIPVVDAGQVIGGAVLVPQMVGSRELPGIIGDSRFGSRDVDMVRVVVRAGQTLVIDVAGEARGDTPAVDSYLRVFNAAGSQIRANDSFAGSRDSRIVITPLRTAVFYVGISGAGNTRYASQAARNAKPGSTGGYRLTLSFSSVPGQRRAAGAVHLLGAADTRLPSGGQAHPLHVVHQFIALAAEPFIKTQSNVTIRR